MSRTPAITELLNGQAVKLGFASTSVTSNRGSARCSARAQVAPPNPPPRRTMRALACARVGPASNAAETAATPPRRNVRRVSRITVCTSMLRCEPSCDLPDFVVGKPFGDAAHHGCRTLAGAEFLHHSDDLGLFASADRGN